MTNHGMFFRMLFGAVFRRRSRAVMAVIASTVGAATLFCLVSVCLVVPQQMTQDMRSYGANLVVTPTAGHQAVGLDDRQVGDLASRVKKAAPAQKASYRYETVRINSTPYTIAGIDAHEVRATNHHWDVEGGWPADGNLMVGQNLAGTLGTRIGTLVTLTYKTGEGQNHGAGTWSKPAENRIQYRVGGIVSTGGNEDDMVYATSADLNRLTGTSRGADVVEFNSQATGDELAHVVSSINGDAGLGAKAQPVTRITSANTRIVTMLQTLFWIVSLVVLALTLVGVGTTISSIVSQRRNEIGLRKALGASSRGIGLEFFAESALYGLCGGLFGTAMGFGFAGWLSVSVFGRTMDFSWLLGVGSVVFTMLVAVLASVPPVRRATRIDPAVVLSEE